MNASCRVTSRRGQLTDFLRLTRWTSRRKKMDLVVADRGGGVDHLHIILPSPVSPFPLRTSLVFTPSLHSRLPVHIPSIASCQPNPFIDRPSSVARVLSNNIIMSNTTPQSEKSADRDVSDFVKEMLDDMVRWTGERIGCWTQR